MWDISIYDDFRPIWYKLSYYGSLWSRAGKNLFLIYSRRGLRGRVACWLVWAALWNFQGQAPAGWELSILSWMVLLRPLRLLQRLGEPLSILLHKHTLCTKTDRGSSSLCSSLRGLNSTIQLRIDSSQPAQACPWKFHNAVYAIMQAKNDWRRMMYDIQCDEKTMQSKNFFELWVLLVRIYSKKCLCSS